MRFLDLLSFIDKRQIITPNNRRLQVLDNITVYQYRIGRVLR